MKSTKTQRLGKKSSFRLFSTLSRPGYLSTVYIILVMLNLLSAVIFVMQLIKLTRFTVKNEESYYGDQMPFAQYLSYQRRLRSQNIIGAYTLVQEPSTLTSQPSKARFNQPKTTNSVSKYSATSFNEIKESGWASNKSVSDSQYFAIKDSQLANTKKPGISSTIKTRLNHKIDPGKKHFLKSLLTYTIRKKARLRGFYSKTVKLLPKQTTGIIIVTNYRSGSTFIGELFNQHPDTFYIFEPLYPFGDGCTTDESTKVRYLLQLLKCVFPTMIDIYAQLEGKMRRNPEDLNCLLHNFCFSPKTKEICSRSLCPYRKHKVCQRCAGPIHSPRAMNVCRSKKITVIKTIRICDVMNLKQLLEDSTISFKVVHLARDPRGIESSRMKIDIGWDVKTSAEQTCNRLLHNGLMGLANTSETNWLRNRYLKVRYEDLSLYPQKEVKRIYQFAGLRYLPQIESWISNNTQAAVVPYKKRNPYSTRRNSTFTQEEWRKHLKFKGVEVVQRACKTTMEFFGYTPVRSQMELTNLTVKVIR